MVEAKIFHSWYPVQIRFRDLDPLGHVNNTVYFIYFEEARSHYFDQLGAWREQRLSEEERQQQEQKDSAAEPHNSRIQTGSRRHRFGTLVKETTCTYELPLVHEDCAEVGVCVSKVGRTSYTMEHVIRDVQVPERVFATGRSVIVWCDYQTGRPYPLPSSLRAAFEQMEKRKFPAPQ